MNRIDILVFSLCFLFGFGGVYYKTWYNSDTVRCHLSNININYDFLDENNTHPVNVIITYQYENLTNTEVIKSFQNRNEINDLISRYINHDIFNCFLVNGNLKIDPIN